METYTWEVLPQPLRLPIEDQLVSEYEWTLGALAARGLAERGSIPPGSASVPARN